MNSKSMKLYGKKAVQFARNNKGMFLQLGMMAVVAGLMPLPKAVLRMTPFRF